MTESQTPAEIMAALDRAIIRYGNACHTLGRRAKDGFGLVDVGDPIYDEHRAAQADLGAIVKRIEMALAAVWDRPLPRAGSGEPAEAVR